jgi:hypothetical protein
MVVRKTALRAKTLGTRTAKIMIRALEKIQLIHFSKYDTAAVAFQHQGIGVI